MRRAAPRGHRAGQRIARAQQRQVEGAPVVRHKAIMFRQLRLDRGEPAPLPSGPGQKKLHDAERILTTEPQPDKKGVGARAAR